MRIAVVIVTYNRKNDLLKTIQAILLQGISGNDIIIINNNSSDESKEILDTEFSFLQNIHLNENIASAGGFSLGMKLALEKGYDWVWLFNDDSRPQKGCLTSVQYFLDESIQKGDVGLVKISEKLKDNNTVLLYWKGVRTPKQVPISNLPVETDLITFDGCFVSANLMKAIGYCDPLYFMGTYEFDYCLKAKDAGFRIFTIPIGMIEDEKKGAATGTPPWRQYYNTRNHLHLALQRKSIYIFKAWLLREIKYTYAIIRFGNKKRERLLFKFRAIRDAILNRRGKIYHPDFKL